MSVPDLVEYLAIIARNGLPQFDNSNLVAIWTVEKANMTSAIITELRNRTGDNLGNNPKMWVQKYGYDSTNAPSQPTRQP
jgi:hypothetical protein